MKSWQAKWIAGACVAGPGILLGAFGSDDRSPLFAVTAMTGLVVAIVGVVGACRLIHRGRHSGAARRFVVKGVDRATGEPVSFDALEAKNHADATARLATAGIAVESVEEAQDPTLPFSPLTFRGRVHVVLLAAPSLFVLMSILAQADALSFLDARPFERSMARTRATAAANPQPDRSPPTVEKSSVFRAPEEVWRTSKIGVINGDTIAPGVTLDSWLCEIRDLRETGARLRVLMGVSNNTGMRVDCGWFTLYLLDSGGHVVWQSDTSRLVVEGRDGFAAMSFEEFCPPAEWARVKTATLWFEPRRR